MRRQTRKPRAQSHANPLPTLRRWLFNAVHTASPHIKIDDLDLTDEDLRKDLVHGRA